VKILIPLVISSLLSLCSSASAANSLSDLTSVSLPKPIFPPVSDCNFISSDSDSGLASGYPSGPELGHNTSQLGFSLRGRLNDTAKEAIAFVSLDDGEVAFFVMGPGHSNTGSLLAPNLAEGRHTYVVGTLYVYPNNSVRQVSVRRYCFSVPNAVR
jgi:hypothetical protein